MGLHFLLLITLELISYGWWFFVLGKKFFLFWLEKDLKIYVLAEL